MNRLEQESNRTLFARPELRFAASLVVFGLAVCYFILGLTYSSGSWAMIDMREWEISAKLAGKSGDVNSLNRLKSLQSNDDARRPFILTLQIPRIPQRGDKVLARQSAFVDEEGLYCFQVFVQAPYYNPDSPWARRSFSVYVSANNRRSDKLRVAAVKPPKLLKLKNIRPGEGGRIRLVMALLSHNDQSKMSWMRASRVNFEFADLYPCGES